MSSDSPALRRVTRRLLDELGNAGHWTGELSTSALSTAVAVIALHEMDRRSGTPNHGELVRGGIAWLASHANADGGWGDTTRSRTNLSTTALVWAAFGATSSDEIHPREVRRAVDWLTHAAGSLDTLVPAIERRYGKDRTFSVPIVLTLALSGRLGPEGWRRVPGLPCELAAFPRSWFGALRLPVVSYALPALIALGQAIHHHAPSGNPLARLMRRLTSRRVLRILEGLQPPNGGFLEATPLTAFVTMSLASMGLHAHPVAVRGAAFLRASVRPDGSWPIDTNLATWGTTLAIKALFRQPATFAVLPRERLRTWLLDQQYQDVHPYTGAAPGGWAWTDLPGGVPDADDTAGALLALALLEDPDDINHVDDLAEFRRTSDRTLAAAAAGVLWLLQLQNRDGGIPTFCRGWGTLPFDRSSPELTAHALRAWSAWCPRLDRGFQARLRAAARRAMSYLARSQRPDGSWIPLWFGNEQAPGDENPVFGTALVLLARRSALAQAHAATFWTAALRFLRNAQNPDGSWGGAPGIPGTIEETSLAVSALAGDAESEPARIRGLQWLEERTSTDAQTPNPIGLYFARLWYHERLYPLVFAADALASTDPGGPPSPRPSWA